MKKFSKIILCLVPILALFIGGSIFAEIEKTPFELIKEHEKEHKDFTGVVYIGKVMTVNYRLNSVEIAPGYHPLLLELTDVIKTPSRTNYIVVLRSYTDSLGSPETNLRLSEKRAEVLKGLMVRNYYMRPERIQTKGYGSANPVASNNTAGGRRLNRRTEIHLFGDVSEAVKFSEKLEGLP